MKYEKRIKYLNVFLNISLGVIMLLFFTAVINPFGKSNRNLMNTVLTFIVAVIFFGGYFMVIFNLKKILSSIIQKNPFNFNNILYFKRIGYYILAVGVIDAVINYTKTGDSGFVLIGTSNGALKPIFFLYLVLSILSFILADVFRMAKEIKDENDLTV